MKCCPVDEKIKKDWKERLEKESGKVSKNKITEITNFCGVFSHPLRVKIALLLNNRDLCVCEMVSILKEKQNLVSHNLSVMKKYNVVSSYDRSKYKYYRIERAAASLLSTFIRSKTG